MNRREFVAGVSAITLPTWPFGTAELRRILEIDGKVQAYFLINAHLTADLAEAHRRSWIGRPFELEGEWYVVETENVDVPAEVAHMPGTVTRHDLVVGAAAAELTAMVGAFRQDNVSIVVRINGDEEALMIQIALGLLAVEAPTPIDIILGSSALQRYVPTMETLGVPVKTMPADTFWPGSP